MSGWLNRLAQGGLLLLLVVAICLGGYSSLLSHQLERVRQQVAEQQKALAQQAGLIATLQTQDAQDRVLMAAQQQQEQQLRQQADIVRCICRITRLLSTGVMLSVIRWCSLRGRRIDEDGRRVPA